MRSDERVASVLSALSADVAQYRYVVSTTLERARKLLTTDLTPASTGAALGEFALGRIDHSRFSLISKGSVPIDAIGCAVLERSVETLESLLSAGDDLFFIPVHSGANASQLIRSRLGRIGSAFGAAGIVELIRRRTYDPMSHGMPSDDQPFEKWTASERRLTPPLVVRVEGADFDPLDLASLIDGNLHIVFLVDGASSVAPLSRLVSPGVFVAQSADTSVLDCLRNLDGPAVVAIMSGNEARFTHDPRGGWASWQRMRITQIPDTPIRKSAGRRSVWQQKEDVAHLKSLADLPALNASTTSRPPASTTVDPAERIAAWLLEQTS